MTRTLLGVEFDEPAALRASTAVAASSIRTTRRPASPSVIGARSWFDAVDEMLASVLQRLGHVELRRPHVAGAVADQHLVALLAVACRRRRA